MRRILELLIEQHDKHMQQTYDRWMAGEEVHELQAYGAGLLHAIRTMQDHLAAEEQR